MNAHTMLFLSILFMGSLVLPLGTTVVLFADQEEVPHSAELCGEFNRISNWVNEVANAVNEIPTEQIPSQVRDTLEVVAQRLQLFYEDASTSEYLTPDERAIGERGLKLIAHLKQRIQEGFTDYVVIALDNITDNLDCLTDNCHQNVS